MDGRALLVTINVQQNEVYTIYKNHWGIFFLWYPYLPFSRFFALSKKWFFVGCLIAAMSMSSGEATVESTLSQLERK